MAGHRPERVARQIVQTLADTVERHTGDERLLAATFTYARVTSDLREATVYFTVLGEEVSVAECTKALIKACGFLRREMGRTLTLRHTPSLRFEHDVSLDRAARIETVLRDLDEDGVGDPSDDGAAVGSRPKGP